MVEAADDICYTIIDFEDGINLGWIEEEYALEYLINLVREDLDTLKYSNLKHRKQRLSYLRALAINSLIRDSVKIFLKNEESILEGTFSSSLLDKSIYKAQIKDIIKISEEKIYQSSEVVQKEIVGHKILSTLLNSFVNAAANTYENKKTSYDDLVIKLLPDGTPFIAENIYETILNATCFVASLTDSKAMHIAEKIGLK